MSCQPCDTITCIYDVPECITSLVLGQDNNSYTSGIFKIYVKYFIGDEEITEVFDYTLVGYSDDIILNTTANLFSHLNGQFHIWVTESTGDIQDKITLTDGNKTATVYGVNFVKVTGNAITSVNAEIV